MTDEAVAAFRRVFGAAAEACGIGPGRVELLGNHTDYNGGCVLTAAIDRQVVVAGRRRSGRTVTVHSVAMNQTAAFDLGRPGRTPDAPWLIYVQAVVRALAEAGAAVPAFEAVITSDLPVGSGLSSSAALECATARLIECFTRIGLDSTALARLLQRAENEFVGVRCGILDQFSSLHGRAGTAIFLDCAALEYEHVPLGERAPSIVLCDSHTPRSLADGRYNERRSECEQAVALLSEALGRPVEMLCQVSLAEFETVASALPDVPAKRARHVIEEHDRVLRARDALGAKTLSPDPCGTGFPAGQDRLESLSPQFWDRL